MAVQSAGSGVEVARLDAGPSLRDQAYAALKQAITSAEIYSRPDEIRLDERALTQQLGVSRTPVREAMTLLEQEGFLRTEPRRGVFIVRKTRRQIVEMIQVWAALEGMAARLVTQRASDKEIAALRDIFDSFIDEHPAEHIDEYSDANIAFHQGLIKLGGSELIVSMTDNLFMHVRSVRKATISHGDRAERSLADHVEKFCSFLD